MQCPKCVELELEYDFSTFCSQDCFKVRTQIKMIENIQCLCLHARTLVASRFC